MKIGKLYIGKEVERITELETANEKLRRKVEKLETQNDVYKEERSEAREVLRLRLNLEADQLAVQARAQYLDKREEYIGRLAQAMKWDKAVVSEKSIPDALPAHYNSRYTNYS